MNRPVRAAMRIGHCPEARRDMAGALADYGRAIALGRQNAFVYYSAAG